MSYLKLKLNNRINYRISHRSGEMNKHEKMHADYLYKLKLANEIIDYKHEAIKLRLADKTFYTPDFFVVYHDRFEIHEVKGFWEDDARVKIKVAAAQFPYFKFIAIKYIRKHGNTFEMKIEEF